VAAFESFMKKIEEKHDETQNSTNFHSIKPVAYTFSQHISPEKKLSSHPDFSLNSV
jgi:hypothetical protein